jgi:hypothetical protein
MTTRKLAVALLTLATLASGSALAASPRLINFQGRLTDASGTPLAGQYAIVFKLWDAPNAGTSCYAETQTVSVNAGLFNATIGSVTPISTTCTFSATTYLELQVGADPAMTPRLSLSPAAYAFSADALDGVAAGLLQQKDPATGNVIVTGKLGIGAAPVEKLDVAGAVNGTELCIGTTCQTAFTYGTVTSLSAGAGITMTPNPITSTGSVAVNTAVIQSRVSTSCGSGAIQAIAANGSPTCTGAPPPKKCKWNNNVYSPGTKCRASSTTKTCSIDNCGYTEASCGSDGSWSTYSTCNAYCAPAC